MASQHQTPAGTGRGDGDREGPVVLDPRFDAVAAAAQGGLARGVTFRNELARLARLRFPYPRWTMDADHVAEGITKRLAEHVVSISSEDDVRAMLASAARDCAYDSLDVTIIARLDSKTRNDLYCSTDLGDFIPGRSFDIMARVYGALSRLLLSVPAADRWALIDALEYVAAGPGRWALLTHESDRVIESDHGRIKLGDRPAGAVSAAS